MANKLKNFKVIIYLGKDEYGCTCKAINATSAVDGYLSGVDALRGKFIIKKYNDKYPYYAIVDEYTEVAGSDKQNRYIMGKRTTFSLVYVEDEIQHKKARLNHYSIKVYENTKNGSALLYQSSMTDENPTNALEYLLKNRTEDSYIFTKTDNYASCKQYAVVELLDGKRANKSYYSIKPKMLATVELLVTYNYHEKTRYNEEDARKYAECLFEELDSGALIMSPSPEIEVIPSGKKSHEIVISGSAIYYFKCRTGSKEEVERIARDKEIPSGDYEITSQTVNNIKIG